MEQVEGNNSKFSNWIEALSSRQGEGEGREAKGREPLSDRESEDDFVDRRALVVDSDTWRVDENPSWVDEERESFVFVNFWVVDCWFWSAAVDVIPLCLNSI